MTFPCRPRAGSCGVWLPGSLMSRGFQRGSRGGASPGVFASACRARFARGAAPARPVADGGWRPSSHSVSGIGPSGSVSGWPAVNASPLPCAAMSGGSACCIAGWSAPPPGSSIGVGVEVFCGGPCIFFAPTVGSPRCGGVGSAGGSASLFVGCAPSRAWPSDTGGGSGRLPGPAGCGAPARGWVRAGSGPGPGPGAGRPGDDGSAGLAVGPVGGAWCRWGAGPACVVGGRSSVLDVAGAWGSRSSVGSWAGGRTVWEGQAVEVSVGVAACACVRGSSGGAYLGPLSAGKVCHGAGRAPGGPVLLLPGWLPALDRVRNPWVVFEVAGFLWGSGSAPCAGMWGPGVVWAGCPPTPYSPGWVRLRSQQVTPGVPGSLWLCGVAVVIVVLPVWTHALVRGSVACRPSMVPERP